MTLIFSLEDKCELAVKAKLLQEVGAIGMIVYTWGGFYGIGYTISDPLPPDVDMPTVVVSRKTGEILKASLEKGKLIEITITPSSEHPWHKLTQGPGGIFVQVYFEIYGFISLVAGIYKLYSFINITGPKFNIPQTCLVLELIAVTSKCTLLVIIGNVIQ